LLLETMQGRIERPLADGQDVTRERLDALGNAPTVQRLASECFENQQIERALEQVKRLGQVDTSIIGNNTSTIDKKSSVRYVREADRPFADVSRAAVCIAFSTPGPDCAGWLEQADRGVIGGDSGRHGERGS